MSSGAGGPSAEPTTAVRAMLREWFLRTLQESSVQRAFDRHVQADRGILRICEDLYDLHSYSRVHVISVGKAAHTMVQALHAQTGDAISGIVAAPSDPAAQLFGFRYFRGAHPVPNDESLRAGDAILKSLHSLDKAALVIFLLSGGGSAVVEKPIDDEISLEDVVATYRALVLSGAPIAEMNAIRKHLSSVKGGRMAQAAYPARQVSVLVSDVPDDALDALASGPTMPDSTSVEDCYRIATKYNLLESFPASVRELFQKRALEETPKSDDPAFIHARWWTALSNATARAAACEAGRKAGFVVEEDNSCDDWDYRKAADYLLDRLREMQRKSPRACLVSGGEVTVEVKGGEGIGGRNQQFALYCAERIAGGNIAVLSGGTDGIDGNSPAAGAVVDGTTAQRARSAGLDPVAALAGFDAYPLLHQVGDAIVTGPTGNNVRDLRILVAG